VLETSHMYYFLWILWLPCSTAYWKYFISCKRHNCEIVLYAQEEYSEMGDFMSKGQADGWLRPVVGREYPLDQAADAHVEVIEHRKTNKGKIVLNVWLFSWRVPLIIFLFRSTPLMISMSVHTYVRPSTKSFSYSNDIWCVGRGRWVMHDGMLCGPIQGQGQGHMALKVRNSSIFKIYLCHFQWELASDCCFLN